MAEAIITRSTLIPEDVLNPIYPVEGRHVILATLRTDKGSIVQDYEINCTDGSAVYNYKTDMNGQVKFSCNSGSANIYVSNVFNGVQYIDFPCFWTNVSAPVGDTSRLNINLPQQKFTEFITNKNFKVMENRTASDIILVGGGGGGGSGYYDGDVYGFGGGGGGGCINVYTDEAFNTKFIKNNIYRFYVGSGGSGGYTRNIVSRNNGNSGGTSYIENMNMSASGGSGGKYSVFGNYTKYGLNNGYYGAGGIGELGNGGIGMWSRDSYDCTHEASIGEDSSVNFAGGGGGGGARYTSNTSNIYKTDGGKPYGGKGALFTSRINWSTYSASSGSRGGGGGGGYCYSNNDLSSGGGGGSGLMRINLNFD